MIDFTREDAARELRQLNNQLEQRVQDRTAELSKQLDWRIQAEAEIRSSEERLNAIASVAMDAIIMIDESGNISFWGGAAEQIFGYSKSEALGQNLHHLLAPAMGTFRCRCRPSRTAR